jgi:hypothetical protein
MGLFLILFFAVSVRSEVKTTSEYVGLTKPTYFNVRKISKSRNASRKDIVQNCWVYKNFSVIEINDPGNKGAVDIHIRPREAGEPALSCKLKYSGKSKTLEHMGGYFVGVVDDHVFIDDADSFGGELAFQVLSSKTGKELYRSIRNTNEKVLVRTGKTVGIRYTKALQVDCPLLEEGKPCWKYILAANRIPENDKMKIPDCKTSFEAVGATPEVRPQLAAWVRVKNLKNPEITYLGGFIKCQPSQ